MKRKVLSALLLWLSLAFTGAADGKPYFPSEDGEVLVLQAGPKYEPLATCDNGDARDF